MTASPVELFALIPSLIRVKVKGGSTLRQDLLQSLYMQPFTKGMVLGEIP